MTTDPITTGVTPNPIAVDYTNRDFYSLREALIEQVKDRVNTGNDARWYGNDTSDFGVALVEAFAYMGDVMHYYIDRVANENALLTATQRESVLNLARSYGYNPSGYQAATTTLTFSNPNLTAGLATLPAGTQVVGAVADGDVIRQIRFTTTAAAVLSGSPVPASVSVTAQHGYNVTSVYPAANSSDIAGEVIGTSDGTANQLFKLAENQVVEGTIKVFVEGGGTYGEWTPTLHLADYGPTDAVYRISVDGANNTFIQFGDGVSGAVPNIYAKIKAQYVVGGGTLGNIGANSLREFEYLPGLTSGQITAIKNAVVVTNTIATGGVEPESLDSIRIAAPAAYASTNRAVTLNDYTGLALQVSGVGKANSLATLWNNVTVYVAPRRDGTLVSLTDVYPGKDSTNTSVTPAWTALQTAVQEELETKKLIGTTVTVSPPLYTDVNLNVVYKAAAGYDAGQVELSMRQLINTYYSYDQLAIQGTLSPQSIELILQYVPGVESVRVNKLYRTGGAEIPATLTGAANEIFVLQGSNTATVTFSTASSTSVLSGLTIYNGVTAISLSPAFSGTTTSYTATATGATTLLVTPTNSFGATIAVGNVVTSSGATRPVTVSGATYTLKVTSVSADGTSTTTYTIVVTL